MSLSQRLNVLKRKWLGKLMNNIFKLSGPSRMKDLIPPENNPKCYKFEKHKTRTLGRQGE
jgi:hypothetical protein